MLSRSPTSFVLNEEHKNKKCKTEINGPGDVCNDESMTILRFDSNNNLPLGVIAWFSTHSVSMNSSNLFISGDNKGYASLKFEEYMKDKNANFIASFPESVFYIIILAIR
jgi:neutral ceramidase